jgi:hypothetical protein
MPWRERFPIHEIGRIDGGRGFRTRKNVFRIGGITFYDRKNKIPMKIPESKRSKIGVIAEFHGIPNGFPILAVNCANGALALFAVPCLHKDSNGNSAKKGSNDGSLTPLIAPGLHFNNDSGGVGGADISTSASLFVPCSCGKDSSGSAQEGSNNHILASMVEGSG